VERTDGRVRVQVSVQKCHTPLNAIESDLSTRLYGEMAFLGTVAQSASQSKPIGTLGSVFRRI